MNRTIICISGLGGAGKTTLAAALAEKIGAEVYSLGAICRAIAYYMELNKMGVCNAGVVDKIMKDPPAWRIIESMASSPIVQQEKYARGAVKLFQVPEVAHWCLEYMKLLPFSFGDCPQIFEGRGIGRLFPTAPVKIWLDGDKETRFRRKHTDAEKFGPAVYSDTVKSNAMRDELEAQNTLVPAKPGHGDIRIDTTRMTREQVLAYVIAVCNYKTLSRH